MSKHTASLQRALDLERYVRNLVKRTHKAWAIDQLLVSAWGLYRVILVAVDGEELAIYWVRSISGSTYWRKNQV